MAHASGLPSGRQKPPRIVTPQEDTFEENHYTISLNKKTDSRPTSPMPIYKRPMSEKHVHGEPSPGLPVNRIGHSQSLAVHTSSSLGPVSGDGQAADASNREPTIMLKRRSSFHVPELRDHPSLGRPLGPSDFKPIQLLGRGDVGKVYLVKEKASGTIYAMKILDKKELIKRKKVQRILTERQVLAALNHPFLVTMYHAFQSADRLFFVISYCAGGEFFRHLQNQPRKSFPENVVKFYSAEVVLAFEYLHMQGVAYRDLKPENLLLNADGHIKLADFDLSKKMTESESHVPSVSYTKKLLGGLFSVNTTPTMKRSNSFVGTEEYIAPEIVLGQGHDTAVDWWTLGILIYEMMFGKTPFRGKDRDETFRFITNEEVNFPRLTDSSPECKSIIRRLLSKQSRRRLGGMFGSSEVKEHIFFKDIKWALIRNLPAPIQPQITNPLDTSNFSSFEDESPIDLEREHPLEDILDPHGLFTDFSYHKKPASNTYSGSSTTQKSVES